MSVDRARLHKLYGPKRPRIAYYRGDFVDYVLMSVLSGCICLAAYGSGNPLGVAGVVLSAVMLASFPVRHGADLRIPLILRRPQDVLYMAAYKLANARAVYFVALALLLLDNYFILMTPALPHHTAALRKVALLLFYGHFVALLVFRTLILVAQLRKRELVREVLTQTAWKAQVSSQPIALEIVHAYVTGVLTHIILLAPWYLVIKYSSFSLLTLVPMCIASFVIYFWHIKGYNDWFYRDHWLGHNSELEFIYLHGTHHDAIPSALIGVSGNGHLEGFLRHSVGVPTPFYSPPIAFLMYTVEIYHDMKNHQYIPGVFPHLPRQFHETCQHSTHHNGRLEPYSIGLKFPISAPASGAKKFFQMVPEEVLTSVVYDEQLTGFRWDNARYGHFLELFDKYELRQPVASESPHGPGS
jgi:hypothetical protein